MSTHSVRINERFVVARTICDDCQAIMDERPATEHEAKMAGTCTLVCDWCKECAPRHQFPLDVPWYTVRGPTIGNLASVTKVRITKRE